MLLLEPCVGFAPISYSLLFFYDDLGPMIALLIKVGFRSGRVF